MLAGLVSCSLLALPSVAAAEPDAAHRPSSTLRSARAEALFKQGEALLEAGQVDSACAKFEASEGLENGLDTLLHLGDCYERAGRTASAWHAFSEAEAVARAQKDSEREQVASQRGLALSPRLTRVMIVVPSTSRVPGLTVTLGENAIPPASWGSPIAVDPGMHSLRAAAKGFRSWSVDLNVSRSDALQYRVDVPTLTPAPAPAPSQRNAYRTAGVVTGSVGLAGLGAGAVFSALAHNAEEEACVKSGSMQCTAAKPSDRNQLSQASAVSFAVGGALLVTGVTLFVLAPSPDHDEKKALRIAARVGTSGGRLQLEGVW